MTLNFNSKSFPQYTEIPARSLATTISTVIEMLYNVSTKVTIRAASRDTVDMLLGTLLLLTILLHLCIPLVTKPTSISRRRYLTSSAAILATILVALVSVVNDTWLVTALLLPLCGLLPVLTLSVSRCSHTKLVLWNMFCFTGAFAVASPEFCAWMKWFLMSCPLLQVVICTIILTYILDYGKREPTNARSVFSGIVRDIQARSCGLLKTSEQTVLHNASEFAALLGFCCVGYPPARSVFIMMRLDDIIPDFTVYWPQNMPWWMELLYILVFFCTLGRNVALGIRLNNATDNTEAAQKEVLLANARADRLEMQLNQAKAELFDSRGSEEQVDPEKDEEIDRSILMEKRRRTYRLQKADRADAKAAQNVREQADREAKERAKYEVKAKADPEAKEQKAEREVQEKADREAQEKADRETKDRAARRADEQAKRVAKYAAAQEAKDKAKREAVEQRAKEQADRQAKREAHRQAKREADRIAQEEADSKAEAEHQAQEDADSKAEAQRQAQEDADSKAQAERQAQEEAEREVEADATGAADPKKKKAHRGRRGGVRQRMKKLAKADPENTIKEDAERKAEDVVSQNHAATRATKNETPDSQWTTQEREARAINLYNEGFPYGHELVFTQATDFKCGFYSLIQSIEYQIPHMALPVPTVEYLAAIPEQDFQEFIEESGMELHEFQANVSVDMLAGIVRVYGERHGQPLRLGHLINGKPVMTPQENMFDGEAPDVYTIWISNNGAQDNDLAIDFKERIFGHWSALKPRVNPVMESSRPSIPVAPSTKFTASNPAPPPANSSTNNQGVAANNEDGSWGQEDEDLAAFWTASPGSQAIQSTPVDSSIGREALGETHTVKDSVHEGLEQESASTSPLPTEPVDDSTKHEERNVILLAADSVDPENILRSTDLPQVASDVEDIPRPDSLESGHLPDDPLIPFIPRKPRRMRRPEGLQVTIPESTYQPPPREPKDDSQAPDGLLTEEDDRDAPQMPRKRGGGIRSQPEDVGKEDRDEPKVSCQAILNRGRPGLGRRSHRPMAARTQASVDQQPQGPSLFSSSANSVAELAHQSSLPAPNPNALAFSFSQSTQELPDVSANGAAPSQTPSSFPSFPTMEPSLGSVSNQNFWNIPNSANSTILPAPPQPSGPHSSFSFTTSNHDGSVSNQKTRGLPEISANSTSPSQPFTSRPSMPATNHTYGSASTGSAMELPYVLPNVASPQPSVPQPSHPTNWDIPSLPTVPTPTQPLFFPLPNTPAVSQPPPSISGPMSTATYSSGPQRTGCLFSGMNFGFMQNSSGDVMDAEPTSTPSFQSTMRVGDIPDRMDVDEYHDDRADGDPMDEDVVLAPGSFLGPVTTLPTPSDAVRPSSSLGPQFQFHFPSLPGPVTTPCHDDRMDGNQMDEYRVDEDNMDEDVVLAPGSFLGPVTTLPTPSDAVRPSSSLGPQFQSHISSLPSPVTTPPTLPHTPRTSTPPGSDFDSTSLRDESGNDSDDGHNGGSAYSGDDSSDDPFFHDLYREDTGGGISFDDLDNRFSDYEYSDDGQATCLDDGSYDDGVEVDLDGNIIHRSTTNQWDREENSETINPDDDSHIVQFRYSYLTQEFNVSDLAYESPYKPDGGFQNGYEVGKDLPLLTDEELLSLAKAGVTYSSGTINIPSLNLTQSDGQNSTALPTQRSAEDPGPEYDIDLGSDDDEDYDEY